MAGVNVLIVFKIIGRSTTSIFLNVNHRKAYEMQKSAMYIFGSPEKHGLIKEAIKLYEVSLSN